MKKILGLVGASVFLSGGFLVGHFIATIPQPVNNEASVALAATGNFNDVMARAQAYWAPQNIGSSGIEQASLATLASQAKAYLASTSPDGSFDIKNTKSWPNTNHFYYTRIMAQAYAIPGTSYYHSAAIKDAVIRTLQYGATQYCPGCNPGGNWWEYEIGIPNELLPTLLIMHGTLDAATESKLLAAVDSQAYVSPKFPVSSLAGENVAWLANNRLLEGLVAGKTGLLADAQGWMERAIIGPPTSIQPDDSFMQADHGRILYTGGYGGDFAADTAKYIYLTQGTNSAVSATAASAAQDYAYQGPLYSVAGAFYSPSVVGREIDRKKDPASTALAAALLYAPSDSRFSSAAAAIISSLSQVTSSGKIVPIELARFAGAVGSGGALPSTGLYYPNADYGVFRTSGSMMTLKLLSSRNLATESLNGENILGSRLSDGMMYLTSNGSEYWNGDFRAYMDWTHLPGVTVEQTANAAGTDSACRDGVSPPSCFGSRSFVGGAHTGAMDAIAMDFAPRQSSVTAKKAYLFFSDSMMFLTSGVSSNGSAMVETTVDQRPLGAGDSVMVNGSSVGTGDSDSVIKNTQSVLIGSNGYFFPKPVDLEVKKATQSGSWSKIGSSDTCTGGGTPCSGKVISLIYQHGRPINPSKTSLAYVVIPNANTSQLSGLAVSNQYQVLQNDSTAAVGSYTRVDGTKLSGFIFWRAGTVGNITASSPLAIQFLENTQGRGILSVANPNQASGSVSITVKGYQLFGSLPAGISSTQTASGITLTFALSGTNTLTALLQLIPPPLPVSPTTPTPTSTPPTATTTPPTSTSTPPTSTTTSPGPIPNPPVTATSSDPIPTNPIPPTTIPTTPIPPVVLTPMPTPTPLSGGIGSCAHQYNSCVANIDNLQNQCISVSLNSPAICTRARNSLLQNCQVQYTGCLAACGAGSKYTGSTAACQ